MKRIIESGVYFNTMHMLNILKKIGAKNFSELETELFKEMLKIYKVPENIINQIFVPKK